MPEPESPDATLFHLTSSPNPAGGEVTIRFVLARSTWARITIHDLQGRLLRVLHQGVARPGENEVRWDRRDARGHTVPAGVYYYRLESAGVDRVAKLVVVR